MTAKRILHVTVRHTALDTRIFHKECRTLAAAGYDVHLIAPSPPAAILDGVQFHTAPAYSPLWQDPLVALRLARQLNKQADALRPDAIHIHDPELILWGLARIRRGDRVILDAHEDYPTHAALHLADRPIWSKVKAALLRRLMKRAIRRFTGFVAATPEIARTYPDGRTALVRNYPILSAWTAPPLDKRVPGRLIYVGGVTRARGSRLMIDALAKLADECEAELLIIGPDYDAGLDDYLAGHPVAGRVMLVGTRHHSEIPNELARARIGLFLSEYHAHLEHSLPVKLFEYMAAALPVVVTDFPLWRQIVESAGCGLVVPAGDATAAARAIERLLFDPQKVKRLWPCIRGNGRRTRCLATTPDWASHSDTAGPFLLV